MHFLRLISSPWFKEQRKGTPPYPSPNFFLDATPIRPFSQVFSDPSRKREPLFKVRFLEGNSNKKGLRNQNKLTKQLAGFPKATEYLNT